MPLTAKDLKWVKSVKKDMGVSWAYMQNEHEEEFPLEFSARKQAGAFVPHQGDVLLLFQTTDMREYKGTFLTHLVTPINNQVEEMDNPAFPLARLVRVIARASLPNPVLMPDDLIFFKPNRGDCCMLTLIERVNGRSRFDGDKIPLTELQTIIWDLFQGHFL